MSEEPRGEASGFSARAVLALVAVGVVALAALVVLGTYAPELRGSIDPGAHALSPSAVGFKGAVELARRLDVPVLVARARMTPATRAHAALVLTPQPGTSAKDLAAAAVGVPTLIVLPKWAAAPHPQRPGFVLKAGIAETSRLAAPQLAAFAPKTEIAQRPGTVRTALRGGGATFAPGTFLPVGPIDSLQTLSGPGWRPALVDDRGAIVLAESAARPGLFVLAEPDLLNTQGLSSLDNARAGMAILSTLRGPAGGVVFDVTLDGYQRGRGLLRTFLEPPWLAATLCGLAAALLMGLHGLARFGPAERRDRAVALGAAALVDSSAGLVRMARKEAELAPEYAELTREAVLRAAGRPEASGEPAGRWLQRLARARKAEDPEALTAVAAAADDRDAALQAARRLYAWRREMTRGPG